MQGRNWDLEALAADCAQGGALTGPYKEHAATSTLALHLLQSSLVHVNTLPLQQVLSEPTWASRLTDEERRGLTALFRSDVNPCGTFRLDMDARLDPGSAVAVPHPRTPAGAAIRSATEL
ncbi:Tn3 family transposase [Streptomyces sp. NPDC056638]|uniref:Tn3 family transposase n=1 Tax=Streptomyces sp. NPDC056638 TaxID=3345887 RepID=UPI00367947DA